MKILALLDGRPGNDNQTIAIAEKLGEYETLKVEFGFWAKLPNFLLGRSLIGVKTPISQAPDIVISTGRKLARVAAYMKLKTHCKAIQLMHPQMNIANFDLVFVPEHDGIVPHKNLHTTFGAPNRIDAELLQKHYGKFPSDINVALIGNISVQDVAKLAKIPNLYVSTSRRTKLEVIEELNIIHPMFMYVWEPAKEKPLENPYYNLLDAAKNIIVSADSVGMISEACTTGKNVFVFGSAKKSKFKNFIIRLIKGGYLKPISDFGASWEVKKLSTRDHVVKIIKNYIES